MKRNKVARLMAMLLSFTMLCTAAACGTESTADQGGNVESQEEQGSGSQQETEGGDEKEGENGDNPFAETIDLSILGYYGSNITVSEESYSEHLIEENFNVNLTPITDVSQENAGTFITSGEILNVNAICTYITGSKVQDIRDLYEQELIREFPEEWLWEYYPTGMKYLQEILGEDYFEKGNHLIDGKCLNVPYAYSNIQSTGAIDYRADWLEKIGMSEPTTLDELHDMLYAFTYSDPDGNGEDDTYGLSVQPAQEYQPILGAFGFTSPQSFVLQDDGSVIYTGATEDYRSALKIMKEWYDEGIVDPECISDDRAAIRTKWGNGQLGAIQENAFWNWSSRGASSVKALVEGVYGKGTVDVLGPLTSPYGDGKVYASVGTPSSTESLAWVFSADTTDEQIIRFLQIQEGLTTNIDLHVAVVYGEEGVDYTLGEDGQIQVMDHVSIEYQAEKGIDKSVYGSAVQGDEMFGITFSNEDKEMNAKLASQPTVCTGNNFIAPVANEAYNTSYSEVSKIVTEYYSNVMLGNDNLESGWDAYLDKLEQAGLGNIIAEYEEMLK